MIEVVQIHTRGFGPSGSFNRGQRGEFGRGDTSDRGQSASASFEKRRRKAQPQTAGNGLLVSVLGDGAERVSVDAEWVRGSLWFLPPEILARAKETTPRRKPGRTACDAKGITPLNRRDRVRNDDR